MLNPKPLPDITHPWLLVCEGFGDAEFFRHLCDVRGISGFQIEHLTNYEKGQPSGNGGFRRYLSGIESRKGSPQAVLIVADSDDEPDKNFEEIKKQIKKAGFAPPDNPLEVKRQSAGMVLVVMMIPINETGFSSKGCLETLLLRAVTHHLPNVHTCAEAYLQCLNTAGWSVTKIDKMKLRCIVAGFWKDDPNISLGYALKPDKGIIPLNHECFDSVANFLGSFRNWLSSQGIR